MAHKICRTCGQVEGVSEYDAVLWDIYHRIDDGRSQRQALWFTAEEFEDSYEPEFDEYNATYAMEKDMHERGLCTTCARPDLSGVKPEQIIPEEDYQDMCDMWAIEEAERRAGC